MNCEKVSMSRSSDVGGAWLCKPKRTKGESYNKGRQALDKSLKAVAHEYRIETALEGHRFFDLVRRGNAAQVLNSYLSVEVTKRQHLSNASFTPGVNERYPIPQIVIAVSNGQLKQNNGYQICLFELFLKKTACFYMLSFTYDFVKYDI